MTVDTLRIQLCMDRLEKDVTAEQFVSTLDQLERTIREDERSRIAEDESTCQFHRDMVRRMRNVDINNERLRSHHEAYGVILEELDEFWEIVRLHRNYRDPLRTRNELLDLAVAAWRASRDLHLEPDAP